MDTGLLPFLSWCIENLAPEAESAARWADRYMAVPDRRERARRMVGDLSSRVVASGTPRDFVEELPGVRGRLGVEAGYLVFRAVKTHLYVAAAQGIPLVDRTMLEDQSLLLLGAEFGLPAFVAALAERNPAQKVMRHHFPRGRGEAGELLGAELARRVAQVEGRSFAGTLRGALEFLTLAAASDFANAYYDDGKVSAEEFAELRRAGARRAVAVTGLLKLVARADGVIDGKLLVSHQDALLMGGKVCAPAGYADHVVAVNPELCRQCDRKICVEICSGQALAVGPEGAPILDREKCVHCGACVWSCSQPHPHDPERSNIELRAGAGGLHSAEN